VDQIHPPLEAGGAVQDAGIRQQMDNHVCPDGDDPAQGMQPAKEEFVPLQETARRRYRSLVHHDAFLT
jgi:hypothetical protein